jgi:hypothetical protein
MRETKGLQKPQNDSLIGLGSASAGQSRDLTLASASTYRARFSYFAAPSSKAIQGRQRQRLWWLDKGDLSAPKTHDVVAVASAHKDLRHVATALRTVDFHVVLSRCATRESRPGSEDVPSEIRPASLPDDSPLSSNLMLRVPDTLDVVFPTKLLAWGRRCTFLKLDREFS